VFIRAR